MPYIYICVCVCTYIYIYISCPLQIVIDILLFQFGFCLFLFFIMLNERDKSEHPCLFPYFRGKVFSFSPLSKMLVVGWWWTDFIMLRYVLSQTFLRVFFIMNEYQILSTNFSVSEIIMDFYISFTDVVYHID